jgi:hypothetical protein
VIETVAAWLCIGPVSGHAMQYVSVEVFVCVQVLTSEPYDLFSWNLE